MSLEPREKEEYGMKRAYIKPAMVTYDRSDIMEMMGPVTTQYVPPPPPPPIESPSCETSVVPASFLQGKVLDLMIVLDSSGPAFERVRITIPGSSPYLQYEFNRADGIVVGDQWSVTIPGFQFLGSRGDYPLVAMLYDDQGEHLSSCQTMISVE